MSAPRTAIVRAFIDERYWPMMVQTLSATHQGRERLILQRLVEAYGDLALEDLTVEHMEGYVARLRGRYAPATVNRHLVRLKHMLNKAARWGYIPASPLEGVKKLREPRTAGRRLTDEERQRLWENAGPKLRPYLVAARYTGARRESLWKLQRRDIDVDQMTIRFRHTKNGDDHVIPQVGKLPAGRARRPQEGAFRHRQGDCSRSSGACFNSTASGLRRAAPTARARRTP